MPGISVNDNGTVKTVTALHVNDAGTVKPVLEAYVNDGGVVKKFWPSVGVPTAPGNYRVTGSSSNSLDLAWNASVANGSPVTGYRIEWGTDGVNFPTGQNFGAATTSATIGSLNSNTLYYTRIKATSALGDSPYSFAQGTTSVATIPQAPTIAVTNESTSSVTLRITAGAGGTPTNYEVERAVNSNAGAGPFSWGSAGSPAYTASPQNFTNGGRPAATAYAWRVRAVNGAGTSSYSNIVYGNTTGDVANGSVTCGVDPEDVGSFKDTGWGSNSAASGNAGQAFGSIFPGSINSITIARFARSGTSTMTIWLEGTSVPSDLFSRIMIGSGQYAYSTTVTPQAPPGGGPSGTLWVSSWTGPANVLGDWINGANVSFSIAK